MKFESDNSQRLSHEQVYRLKIALECLGWSPIFSDLVIKNNQQRNWVEAIEHELELARRRKITNIKLPHSFNAKTWADEFIKNNPDKGLNRDLMIVWFANAIMAGYDEAMRILPKYAKLHSLKDNSWINNEIVKVIKEVDKGYIVQFTDENLATCFIQPICQDYGYREGYCLVEFENLDYF